MNLFNTASTERKIFRRADRSGLDGDLVAQGKPIVIPVGRGVIVDDDEWAEIVKKSRVVRAWVKDGVLLVGDDAIEAQPKDVPFIDLTARSADDAGEEEGDGDDLEPSLAMIANSAQLVVLELAGLGLEEVAAAEIADLTALEGIGEAGAKKLISAAKDLVE